MPKAKITKRTVEAIKPVERDTILWDTELKGFGCKVTPKGRRVYFVYYRSRDGQQRRPTIGVHGAVTCENARDTAREWLGDAAKGGDPSADRHANRQAPTMAELAARFMSEHAEIKKRPGSVRTDKILLRLHILPAIGKRKVASVTRTDVQKLHYSMRDKAGAANRVVSLLSKMLNLAEKWGLRPDGSNPCRHVEKYPEHKLERFLSGEEFARLGHVLAEAERTRTETPSTIAAIRLLAFTGCRLSEILTLHWDYVDFERRCLNLPESKTGAKLVPLTAPALEVLSNIDREDDNPHVIAGRIPGSHLVNLQKAWGRIRAKAELDGVRLHDLRHSFASVAAGAGFSLLFIGKMLGHSQAQTTARYAHLAANPLQQAMESVAGTIASAMSGNNGDVVELNGRTR